MIAAVSPSTSLPLLSSKASVRIKSTSPIARFVVNFSTTTLWAIFRINECILCLFTLLWLRIQQTRRRLNNTGANNRRQRQVRTVVIIGGNFSGLAALWELNQWQYNNNNHNNNNNNDDDYDDDVRIVLIDQRDYSEYTPGVLRLYCDPWHFFRLAQKLPETNEDNNFVRIRGTVTSIVDDNPDCRVGKIMKKVLTYTDHNNHNASVTNNNDNDRVKTIRYDYLILATGATYPSPISPATASIREGGTTILDRNNEWHNAHTKLKGAKRVLILGGGAVGVELVAEIVDHYNSKVNDETTKKHVTIVDAQPTLVPLFPKSVGKYAEDWLSRRGVEIRLSENLKSWNDRGCVLADGTVLHADVVYVCFGNHPNSKMVEVSSLKTTVTSEEKKDNDHAFFSLTKRRNILVKDTLQLVINGVDPECSSSCSWFACGDVASPPTNDQKQAFQAEMQGKVAAKNVIKMFESSKATKQELHPQLFRYPQDISCSDHIPLVFVLSLGRYDGVLGFNNMCITGPFAAVVKYILEDTKVSHMRGRTLGKLIWKIGDAVTLFISRYVILPSSSSPTSDVVSQPITSTSTSRLIQQNPQRRQQDQQLKLS